MRFIMILILLSGFANLFGDDLGSLIQGAVEGDRPFKRMQYSLEKLLLVQQKEGAYPAAFSVGTGNVQLAYNPSPADDETEWTFSLSPSLHFSPAGEEALSVDLSVPVVIRQGGAIDEYLISPEVSVKQPLNKLLGMEEVDLALFRRAVEFEGAKQNVAGRLFDVEAAVLSALSALYSFQEEIKEGEISRKDLEEEIDEARRLNLYAPGSSAFKSLLFSLESLMKVEEIRALKFKRERERLEGLTGLVLENLPVFEAPVEMVLIKEETRSSREIVLAALRLTLAEETLKSHIAGKLPQISVGAAYGPDFMSSGLQNHEVSAIVEVNHEELSFSGSGGFVLDTGGFFVSAGVTLNLPDGEIKALEQGALEKEAAINRLALEEAEENLKDQVELFNLQILELNQSLFDFLGRRELVFLELQESRLSYEKGFISPKDYELAGWAYEKLEYEEKRLVIQQLLLKNSIDRFFVQIGVDDGS